MKLSSIFLVVYFFSLATLQAQLHFEEDKFSGSSADYYLFPIKPGTSSTLSGTMGELRSSHFHAGIDIRTGGNKGLPVQAAADGYIWRVAVSKVGYGNALYVKHPNGHTTVYAHLDRFQGEVADYIRREQYRRKTFETNLYFRKGQFAVKKGDTIALSGNSGSSGGPHLHFEIRNKNQELLNPLKYSFDEVIDRTPPLAKKIAIKTMTPEARVNGQHGRFEFPLVEHGNRYVINETIKVSGELGVELYAYDKLDFTHFKCGINRIALKVNGDEIFRQEVKTFGFHEQRNILSHMNYQVKQRTGERFHKLYVDDGNKLRFYTTNNRKGKFLFGPSGEYDIEIAMWDSYENLSKISFKVLGTPPHEATNFTSRPVKDVSFSLLDNTLKVNVPQSVAGDGPVAMLRRGNTELLEPVHVKSNSVNSYLIDLRKGLPTEIVVGSHSYPVAYHTTIPSEIDFEYFGEMLDIKFPARSLFDTLYLSTEYYYDPANHQEYFDIANPYTPVRKNITLKLKPASDFYVKGKSNVYSVDRAGNYYYQGGYWERENMVFKTRSLGTFTILSDTVPPVITPVLEGLYGVKYEVTDQLSGIRSIEGYLDGDWVLMAHDPKTRLVWSEKLDPTIPFRGNFKLKVTDRAGNLTFYTTKIP